VIVAILAVCPTTAAPWMSERLSAHESTSSVFVEPRAGDGPVISLLSSAKRSIRLEVYELTDSGIFNALAEARKRHVLVQVILEHHPDGGDRFARIADDQLRSAGIAVRWANEAAFTYTHEKAVDIDNRVAGIFTFNLSYSAFSSNREFGVIDRNPSDAKEIGAIFQADWTRTRAKIPTGDLVVSPVNARSRITSLIESARHTLDLYEEEMDDRSIESKLAQAVHRGVKVRLITSDDSSGVDWVRSKGVAVVLMADPYVHAKAIVADGKTVFIGSENISSTSLDRNREMGIILRDTPAANSVETTFRSDWKVNRGNTKAPPAGRLTLALDVTLSSVKRYELLTITAETTPSASCTIKVTYPDGYVSRATELRGARIAGSTGRITWSWHVGSTVTGSADATVKCRLSAKTAAKSISFSIAK